MYPCMSMDPTTVADKTAFKGLYPVCVYLCLQNFIGNKRKTLHQRDEKENADHQPRKLRKLSAYNVFAAEYLRSEGKSLMCCVHNVISSESHQILQEPP